MQTLSNGYQKPETGDRGNVFFPALEGNIQRVNDHTHDGNNSEKLDAQAVNALSGTIIPGDWTTVVAGQQFRAVVTMPGSLEFDTTHISLRLNNITLFSKVEKITNNTFYVYTNDNSTTVTVIYS